MKKILKRLCTGFLAFATIATSLSTTTVHAESKQYWTESAERVGIVERVNNDGSISETFNEGHMTVEGEDAYCIDINTSFKNGYKTRADASTRMSADQIADVALSIKDLPTQTAYAVHSAKENVKSNVSDFQRGVVQEQKERQSGRLEKQQQHKKNIADKRMELQKAQEARQAQRKSDGSATNGATRPHERPATASKPSVEKPQEIKRPATATASKASEPVRTSVTKERPLSSGTSATQNVKQEKRQNYTADRKAKVQQAQSIQKNQQTTEKNRKTVSQKGRKKK